MAKESMKAREVKRRRMVEKYAAKKQELKAAGDYIGLQKIPKNASKIRLHNRCSLSGRPTLLVQSRISLLCKPGAADLTGILG